MKLHELCGLDGFVSYSIRADRKNLAREHTLILADSAGVEYRASVLLAEEEYELGHDPEHFDNYARVKLLQIIGGKNLETVGAADFPPGTQRAIVATA